MFRKFRLALGIPCTMALSLSAQNLVPNPSFEKSFSCPKTILNVFDVEAWGSDFYDPSEKDTSGLSCAYHNSCANKDPDPNVRRSFGLPSNKWGFQNARTGNAYMRIANHWSGLETKLVAQLLKDSIYYVEFFASLADASLYSSSALGAYLSDSPIQCVNLIKWNKIGMEFSALDRCVPQVKYRAGFISDTSKWTRISGYYKAHGGEQYITISGFKMDSLNVKSNLPGVDLKKTDYPSCQYFIDDVLVMLASQKDNLDNFIPEKGSTLNLKNILFETGKAVFLPASDLTLGKLVQWMNKNVGASIEVSGHTDNTGDARSNLTLSTSRAKAIADYLVSKGISKERVKFKGYGSSRPVADNSSDSGRQLNRRVEITVLSFK
jgi:OOP family OmpA-OmpF porin